MGTEETMKIKNLAAQAAAYLDENVPESGKSRPAPGMILYSRSQPTQVMHAIYEPIVCLILQGKKELTLEQSNLILRPGESLLVSHGMPVAARITKASPLQPYLSIVLTIDLVLLRSLYEQVGPADRTPTSSSPRSLAVEKCEPRLVDCLSRYLALAGSTLETKVMAPLILREIHFRLLIASYGGMLRELLRHDSHASSISRAIARIRRDFRTAMVVPDLAREFGMSSSSFHKRFKSITSISPLQYQKELRLLEAKRLLSLGNESVSDIAFQVGYESPNQFSREFARKFGEPPSAAIPKTPPHQALKDY